MAKGKKSSQPDVETKTYLHSEAESNELQVINDLREVER